MNINVLDFKLQVCSALNLMCVIQLTAVRGRFVTDSYWTNERATYVTSNRCGPIREHLSGIFSLRPASQPTAGGHR